MSGKFWDRAWSLVECCTPVSEGCKNCWLAAIDRRFQRKWEHMKVIFREDRLNIPLRIKKPTVFALWSDLFHEAVPWEFQIKAFEVMAEAARHTFLILTKRPKLMADFIKGCEDYDSSEWTNVWFGTTVENQKAADERISHLLRIPGNKFLSIEPMLSGIDLASAADVTYWDDPSAGIQFVILGGETGPKARPVHPDWVRSVRDQCALAGVTFFFKSWGEFAPVNEALKPGEMCGKPYYHFGLPYMKRKVRLLDGREYNNLPWKRGNV